MKSSNNNAKLLRKKFCNEKDKYNYIFISEDNIFEKEEFKQWKHHFVKKDGQNLPKVSIGNKIYTAYTSNFTSYITKSVQRKNKTLGKENNKTDPKCIRLYQRSSIGSKLFRPYSKTGTLGISQNQLPNQMF